MRRLAAVVVVFFALLSTGCRRAPANPPLLYKRKASKLSEKIRAKKLAEESDFASDRYAWEGRLRPIDRFPDRLLATQERLKAEMELLDLIVHGKKPGK